MEKVKVNSTTLNTRILNLLLDSVIFILFVFLVGFSVKGFITSTYFKGSMIIFYYLYYFLFESISGKTPAKFLTKTQVIDINTGAIPGPLKILLRTLLRMIPVDIFSFWFFTTGIHDKWSNTTLKYT